MAMSQATALQPAPAGMSGKKATDSISASLAAAAPLPAVPSIVSANYHPTEGRLVLDDVDNTYTEEIILRPKFSTITLMAEPDVEIRIDGELVGKGSWTGNLNAGGYNVECRKNCFRSNVEVLNILEGKDETITLKPLQPIEGNISIVARGVVESRTATSLVIMSW